MDLFIPIAILTVTQILSGFFQQEKIPRCHRGEGMSGGVSTSDCKYEKACRTPEEKERMDKWFEGCSAGESRD